MQKQLVQGNEAILKSAILAGCRAFYGYPITPATEITEHAAYYMPQVGGVFLQAESEVAAINMLYGAAAAGMRCMTASSGPGISLMQEGLSYLSCAELPCVVADIVRAGPGLGHLGPEQGDYHQVVKGGGHGNYRTIVLAPHSVQEMADLTGLAFELADRYRNPTFVLADSYLGQIMEPVQFADPVEQLPDKPWAIAGASGARRNVIKAHFLRADDMETHVRALEAKYKRAEEEAVRFESYQTADAEIILVSYGVMARIAKAAVRRARAQGLRLGLLRPITLYPFPTKELQRLSCQCGAFAVVELSNGQLRDDVRLAVEGGRPVEFYSRVGGNVPQAEEVLQFARTLFGKTSAC